MINTFQKNMTLRDCATSKSFFARSLRAFLSLTLIGLFVTSEAWAQGKVACDGSLYFTRQISPSTRISAVSVAANGVVSVTDKATLSPNANTNATVFYNGYLFTQRWDQQGNFTLLRIGKSTDLTTYEPKTVTGMPTTNFNNAGVDKEGIMYILSAPALNAAIVLYKIDLKTWETSENLSVTTAAPTMAPGARLWGDIAFDPLSGKAYAWYHTGTTPTTGQAVRGLYEIQNITSATPSIVKVGAAAEYTMGTLFFNERGQLFSYGVAQGGTDHVNFYYIDKATGAVTSIGSSATSPQSDGCECAYRLSLTLTAGDGSANVDIPNCSNPSNFNIRFGATNTASGDFSDVTFTFPLDSRFKFADSQSDIDAYMKSKFGSSASAVLSDDDGGTDNLLTVTGIAIGGTTGNGGNTVSIPFEMAVRLAGGGNDFTNGEKVQFQAEFGGLEEYYGYNEPSSDPLSFFGKRSSEITFNKVNALCQSISGNVFHDVDGLKNLTVDGSNISSDLGLKAVLVDAGGRVSAITNVVAGVYSFTAVSVGTYSIILTTAELDVDDIGELATGILATPPTGWANTGENLGTAAGNDNLPNGILTGIEVKISDVITNANFGIQQPPTATSLSYVLTNKPVSGNEVPLDGTIGASSGSGSKLEPLAGEDSDEDVTHPKTFKITSLPAATSGTVTGTAPQLFYDGDEVKQTDIDNGTPFSDPSLFSVKLNGTGYSGVSFGYKTVDAAGAESNGATYSVTWNSPLPVTLVSFEANTENGLVRLSWQTTQETNASHFELQRSNDAKTWSRLEVIAAVGESRGLVNYDATDKSAFAGINYYRLKMVDLDGSLAYSRIVNVKLENNPLAVSVHPNPVSGVLKLSGIALESVRRVYLTNMNGQIIARYNAVNDEGIDLSRLASGIYQVQITTADGSLIVKKILISK